MTKLLWFLCALGLCLLAGCSRQQEAAQPPSPAPEDTPAPGAPISRLASAAKSASADNKLQVLATIAPMYCFTKNIAGDLADVELIIPPGTPAQGFHPSPDETQKILHAGLIVENGFGFEPWMDQLEAHGLSPGVRMIASRGAGPGIPGLPGDPNSPPADLPSDSSGPPDPHVWLDPVMAIKELQNIRDALMAHDPAHAADYFTNESRYETTLRDLDDEIGRTTVDIKKRRLLCVTSAFSYFLSRYEFPVAATVATPAALSAANTGNADAVLVPSGPGQPILNTTLLPIVKADPMDTGSASADFYEQVTRANAEALLEGLPQ